MILANEAQTRPYQYYVTVCLSVLPTKQFSEAPVVTVQQFVCDDDQPGELVWNKEGVR